ncbi:alpha-amylase family glycosyl hydrolase, partial [Acinetobacter baumannii]
RARPAQRDVIYFVLPDRFANGDLTNDRGNLKGDRLRTGYDPTHKGFYHGGDLKGLTQKLDYIESLGATAIWVGPVMTNKPVQGPPGQETAG